MKSLRCAIVGLAIACGALLAACGSSDKTPAAITPSGGSDGGGDAEAGTDGAVELPDGCAEIEPTYAEYAEDFFAQRCIVCHSASATGDARLGAPVGVDFDTEADIAFNQARIQRRAIDERGMPPGAPLSDCDAAQLESYLKSLDGAGACEPQCSGKDCGPDGCGGVCGTCETGEMCGSAGLCVAEGCMPDCAGVACGDDGCGGVCGACGPGLGCDGSGQCVCAPQCDGKSCGEDGCGGTCGECTNGDVCGVDGSCICIPSCDGKVCGDDGCGGSCGFCGAGKSCVAGACEACVPIDCTNVCGDDGCGSNCTDCAGVLECDTRADRCVPNCTSDCTNRECGDDGCGGTCGAPCAAGDTCNVDGQCECAPFCEGKACGDDGCGGSCGPCTDGLTCDASGQCGCSADCTGRECGGDGCGGTCGACADGLSCNEGSCVDLCVPSCSGKQCGDDGCGGSCGSCGAAQSCDSGECIAVSVSFDTVFAIFQKAGCADTGCHGGARPAEMLNLSSASGAEAELVGVTSDQCSPKKLVLPGDPTQSYLINKLTGVGMCSGSQMPKGNPALSAADIDTIRAWISGL